MANTWTRDDGASLPCMNVYQELVKSHVRQTLEVRFPVVSQTLSPREWSALVDVYFRDLPESKYEGDHVGTDFHAFLESHVGSGHLPISDFYVELAELEWNLLTASQHGSFPADLRSPRPMLNPTLAILEVRYPVVDFYDRWMLDEEFRESPVIPDPLDKSGFVFIFSIPESGLPAAWHATDELLFVFKAIHDRLTVLQAAQLGELAEDDARELMARAIRIGLVIPGSSDDPSAQWL